MVPDNTLSNVTTIRPKPQVIPRSEHNISRSQISENALKVLYRLKSGGYQAYLVGGSVRDMLLGREPKDFDVATDAHPEQIRELFNTFSPDDLDKIVEGTPFKPPPTVGMSIVGLLSDGMQHAGQAGYVRGLHQGMGWH